MSQIPLFKPCRLCAGTGKIYIVKQRYIVMLCPACRGTGLSDAIKSPEETRKQTHAR